MTKKTTKPTRKEKESTPPSPELKMRILKAKERLPNSGVSSFFIHLYPEYDNTKGRSRLANALQTRITDEDITEKLEKMADLVSTGEIKPEQITEHEKQD